MSNKDKKEKENKKDFLEEQLKKLREDLDGSMSDDEVKRLEDLLSLVYENQQSIKSKGKILYFINHFLRIFLFFVIGYSISYLVIINNIEIKIKSAIISIIVLSIISSLYNCCSKLIVKSIYQYVFSIVLGITICLISTIMLSNLELYFRFFNKTSIAIFYGLSIIIYEIIENQRIKFKIRGFMKK